MTNTSYKPPLASWIGGKSKLAKTIVERIPEHTCYCEPFCGAAWVLFSKPPSKVEVINDRSGDVATFFRVLQRHYLPFVEMLRWQVASRREFERLMATDPATLTDLERAARFLYLQRVAFGGKVAGRTFGVRPIHSSRFDVTKVVPILEELHERLAAVTIESLDWADFLPRYDRPGTLFYLDPPYWGCEKEYGEGFQRADFEQLAEVLKGLQGRFILSINDVPDIRRTFAGFTIKPVSVLYSMPKGSPKRAKELIIMGPAKGTKKGA